MEDSEIIIPSKLAIKHDPPTLCVLFEKDQKNQIYKIKLKNLKKIEEVLRNDENS